MKLTLKETTKVKVGRRMEDSYHYEDETGKVVVQFNAGSRAWTYEIGLATNQEGSAIAQRVITAFLKAGQDAIVKSNLTHDAIMTTAAAFDEAIKVLEV